MNAIWFLLALWIGTCAGILVFALMAMARDGERHELPALARLQLRRSSM